VSVLMVQSKVRADAVAEVDAAVERLFAAIDSAQLDGVRYASLKASDGVTYVALLEVEEGVDNPLPALPEFQEFQESLKGWVDGPPQPDQLSVVGSYRLF
jgi:hypothetical protein